MPPLARARGYAPPRRWQGWRGTRGTSFRWVTRNAVALACRRAGPYIAERSHGTHGNLGLDAGVFRKQAPECALNQEDSMSEYDVSRGAGWEARSERSVAEERLSFVRKVYSLFFAAILVCAGGVYLSFNNPFTFMKARWALAIA